MHKNILKNEFSMQQVVSRMQEMMIEKQDIKNLKKRYLLWLYKTTKETLDKIERKFTQLEIDKFILKELSRLDKNKKIEKHIREFESYIQHKEKEGLSLKYEDRELKPNYLFLVLKLKAIEKATIKEFGNSALRKIKFLYEEEMISRILKSTESK